MLWYQQCLCINSLALCILFLEYYILGFQGMLRACDTVDDGDDGEVVAAVDLPIFTGDFDVLALLEELGGRSQYQGDWVDDKPHGNGIITLFGQVS